MASGRQLNVLVVDHDEAACSVTSLMLEDLGYHAQCETHSLMALRIFSEEPDKFDFAILEPIMPELMGVELAVRFRRIRPGFPVVFYAGYLDEHSPEGIEAARLGRVILKPLMLKELAVAIKDHLH